MTDIGRAGIVMKGDYNSASTYETLDAVSYQNGLYVAKQNVPAGIVPTNTTYWQCAVDDAAKADKIVPAASGNFAALNASGNLEDSGVSKASMILKAADIGLNNSDVTITFSGKAYCRRPHYMLLISGFAQVMNPVIIAFKGGSTSYVDITDVIISDDLNGKLTVSGTSITIAASTGYGWGMITLFNLISSDDVAYSIS